MIKDGKEHILCLNCRNKQVDIIHYQHIYELIEMNEIIYLIILRVVNKLVDEFFRAHIKHRLIRVQAAHFIANRLHKMCFSPSHTAEDNQWIERSSSRLLGHMYPC